MHNGNASGYCGFSDKAPTERPVRPETRKSLETRNKRFMVLQIVLVVLLVLLLLGALPTWPHSRSWGYGPSGLLGVLLVVLLVLILFGVLA